MVAKVSLDMSHGGRLNSFVPITIAAWMGLVGVLFGDDNTLAPVPLRVTPPKMAT